MPLNFQITTYVVGAARMGKEVLATIYTLREYQPLVLVREPANPFDRNAIRVTTITGATCGYVQREIAAKVAPIIDLGHAVLAKVITPVVVRATNRVKTYPRALLWLDISDENEDARKTHTAPLVKL